MTGLVSFYRKLSRNQSRKRAAAGEQTAQNRRTKKRKPPIAPSSSSVEQRQKKTSMSKSRIITSPKNQIHHVFHFIEQEPPKLTGHESGNHGNQTSEKTENTIFQFRPSFFESGFSRACPICTRPLWSGAGYRWEGEKGSQQFASKIIIIIGPIMPGQIIINAKIFPNPAIFTILNDLVDTAVKSLYGFLVDVGILLVRGNISQNENLCETRLTVEVAAW